MPRVLRSHFFVLFADLLLMLVAWFILQNRTQSQALIASQQAAATVPGLQNSVDVLSGQLKVAKGEVAGKQGELDQARKDLTKAKQEGDQFRSVVAGKDVQIGKAQSTIKELSGQLSDLKKHFRASPPVTLLVMLDVTESLEQLIPDLKDALGILFETLPHISESVNIGVIAFRDGVVDELPIMQVLPKYEDNGASQQQVLKFVGALRVKGSNVRYRPVFKRAAEMLKGVHPTTDPRRKVRLVLISDTGCGEDDNRLGYNANEHELKNYLLRNVRKWAANGDRGVAALYAESENSKREGTDQQVSKRWFADLGSVSPKSASYTNANHLLRAVLRASLE